MSDLTAYLETCTHEEIITIGAALSGDLRREWEAWVQRRNDAMLEQVRREIVAERLPLDNENGISIMELSRE